MIYSILKGIPISKGIVIGEVKKLEFFSSLTKKNSSIEFNEENEINKLEKVLNELIIESKRIENKYNQNEKIRSIIQAEIMFLEDFELKKNLNDIISEGNSCEAAIEIFFENYIKLFKSHDNLLSKIKINDIGFLKHKIVQNLNDVNTNYTNVKDKIIITSILNSDEILKIYEHGAIGFVTEYGSNLSHSSIISRSLNIPAVFGIGSELDKVSDGDTLIVDGNLGEVHLNPDILIIQKYKQKQKSSLLELKSFKDIKDVNIRNNKEEKISFFSNINNIIDLENTLINNADGIGLVRTENLVKNLEDIFDEDLQFEIYNKIAESIYPKIVTFRLFDFGYDKLNLNDEKEDNPALGLRGIRYLLKNKHILGAQTRALIRASFNGNLNILIPMVTNKEEVINTRDFILFNSRELAIHCPKIGTMIETPAAAFITEDLCEVSDFISVGTNDLMQYFFAADRNNDLVSNYLNYRDESFLKLLLKIKKECENSSKSLTICGQIASDENSLKYLVKKGFTSFSVIPSRILFLKKLFINN